MKYGGRAGGKEREEGGGERSEGGRERIATSLRWREKYNRIEGEEGIRRDKE